MPDCDRHCCALLLLLQVDLGPLSREALMCFAINLYNTLCIHTLVVHGPERYNDNVGRMQFFRKVCGQSESTLYEVNRCLAFLLCPGVLLLSVVYHTAHTIGRCV
jgi:hypothetical protein